MERISYHHCVYSVEVQRTIVPLRCRWGCWVHLGGTRGHSCTAILCPQGMSPCWFLWDLPSCSEPCTASRILGREEEHRRISLKLLQKQGNKEFRLIFQLIWNLKSKSKLLNYCMRQGRFQTHFFMPFCNLTNLIQADHMKTIFSGLTKETAGHITKEGAKCYKTNWIIPVWLW